MKTRLLSIGLMVILAMSVFAMGCAPEAASPSDDAGSGAVAPTDDDGATPAAPEGKTFNWKMQTYYPTADPAYGAMVGVTERIADASGGRLMIECFPGGSIVPQGKELDSLNQGVFDMAYASHGFQTNLFPAAFLFAQRIGGLTPIQAMTWLRYGGGDELAAELYAPLETVHYVATPIIHPPEVWCHSNKKLESLADFQGLKIRSPGDSGAVLSLMGASSVSLPGSEIYESAQRGVIDATEYITQATNWDMGFQEVFDYMYMSPVRAPSDSIAMWANSDSWDEIGPDMQAIVEACMHEETMRWYAWSLNADSISLQKFKDYGTIVETIPADIDAKLVEMAGTYFSEKAAGDTMFKKVMDAQDAWKALCQAQGPWAD